ncbi:hypothetical protein CALCODRAFT_322612 [Calocera cornea HHB12733]|uniref:Uncharacterized protein n=1 Tax=Calocera cornea HHB12733 TaxID=1353952 RepID=A0A165F549_9BASI|nr:hypothetical protein CALCODRAFT_322612 [Calocera cornea HHB12733]
MPNARSATLAPSGEMSEAVPRDFAPRTKRRSSGERSLSFRIGRARATFAPVSAGTIACNEAGFNMPPFVIGRLCCAFYCAPLEGRAPKIELSADGRQGRGPAVAGVAGVDDVCMLGPVGDCARHPRVTGAEETHTGGRCAHRPALRGAGVHQALLTHLTPHPHSRLSRLRSSGETAQAAKDNRGEHKTATSAS